MRERPSAPGDQDPWACGWESNRTRQLASGLALTPAQRLAWLCAMIELAWRAGALPRRRPLDTEHGER